MTNTLGFLIRDGLESDIGPCLKLDHGYETNYVWQVQVAQETGQWQITFKNERLPRTLDVTYPADERRLRLSLPPDQGFLIAVSRTESDVLGYLTLRSDPVHQIAFVHDLVVSRPYRRHSIGTRLLNVARQWAKEHDLTRLTAEIQTKNFPAIAFCQNAGFTFCGFNDRYLPHQDIAVFFSQSIH